MPSALHSQHRYTRDTSPALVSTYRAVRRGTVPAKATVAPGRAHDAAWFAANAAWDDTAARRGTPA